MGAEMLVQSIGFMAKDGHQIDEEWAASAFAKARRTIDAIDRVRMTDINDPQASAYTDVESCKQRLLSDVAEVEAALLGHRRQAAVVDGGGGVILLLSGGMSWGDSPTELFDAMTRLLEADVIADARWPDTDRSDKPSTNE